jgi:predicted unusual protein kinase regulating ubiquinone biosynthesis (AarF/ABC1/UbiB family)
MLVCVAAGVFQTALAGGVSNISFSSLSADLGRTMYRYSFRIPPYYTLLVRSLSVLEGIALASDPNYKVGILL